MYAFLQPKTLTEAVELLREKQGLRILAGGTDLIIGLKNKSVTCSYLMDCKRIPELQVLEVGDDGLEIGGAVTLNRLINADMVRGPHTLLKEGARVLANGLLRNRATLVGNLCNASPGGDMLAISLVLDGVIEAVSPRGTRQIPLKEFFTGVKRHVLEADEMAVKVIFPDKKGTGAFRKKRRIRGHDLAQVGVAGFLNEDGRLRLAFGAVGPTPILLEDVGTYTTDTLRSKREHILDKAVAAVSPIGDVRSTKEYRLAMVRYLTGQILDELSGEVEVGA